MNNNDFEVLGDAAANVVENLAYRIAQQEGGRITVNHLAPYLPLALMLAIVFVLILLRFPLPYLLPAFLIASLYAIVKILWGRKQV